MSADTLWSDVSSLQTILIVGAGPAGCAAAYDLAEAGERVLLLDRRSFPRPKACACGLTRKTLKALRYAVDPVVEHVCGEIVLESPARTAAGFTSPGPFAKLRLRDSKPIAAMAVRERFDAFCLEQTLKAGQHGGGVTLARIESVAAVRRLADGVVLDVVRSDGGSSRMQSFAADVVIGADGSNGQMRRLAAQLEDSSEAVAATPSEASWYTRGFALEAMVPYRALPQALPEGDGPRDLLFDFSPLPGGYGWLFPKGDHINVGVGAFAPSDGVEADLKQVTRALLADYTRRKLGVELAQLEDGPTVTGQYLGMGGHAYVPCGRVLLAGDAAGLVDPLTGEGIHSAVTSGQAAAAAIIACRAHGRGLDLVAHEYAQRLAPLQETLAFSDRAARSFYREPTRGFRVMQTPLVGSLALKTYTDGLPVRLLRSLVRFAARR